MRSVQRVSQDALIECLVKWPHINNLDGIGFRKSNTAWAQIATALKLKNSFSNRKWLYNQWNKNTGGLRDVVLRLRVSPQSPVEIRDQEVVTPSTTPVPFLTSTPTTPNPHRISNIQPPLENKDQPSLHCICQQPNDGRPYVLCEKCHKWYHFDCVGYVDNVGEEDKPYTCNVCSIGRDESRDLSGCSLNESLEVSLGSNEEHDLLSGISRANSVVTSELETNASVHSDDSTCHSESESTLAEEGESSFQSASPNCTKHCVDSPVSPQDETHDLSECSFNDSLEASLGSRNDEHDLLGGISRANSDVTSELENNASVYSDDDSMCHSGNESTLAEEGESSFQSASPNCNKHCVDSPDDELIATSPEEHTSPKKFSIFLSTDEWSKIKPKRKHNRLRNQWTDVVYDKFREINNCVLVFKYNRAKVPNSRKRKGPYLKLIAVCKFKDCCKYIFTLKKVPVHEDRIKMRVIQKGEINHKAKEGQKRHMKGDRRRSIATELDKVGVGNWYYQTISQMTNEEKKSGNLTACSSADVLRKILSEKKGTSRLHDDILQEVKLLQEVYKEVHPASKHTEGGFVQYFSSYPFKVHMMLDDQAALYLNEVKNGDTVLYLDATGSLVKNIPGQKKQVFYYALIMENPIKGRAGIPVSEMLTNDQHASEIKHFLSRFVNTVSKSRAIASVVPRRVETDFSWALLQSVLYAFNAEECKAYLERTYRIVQGMVALKDVKSYTYPHICAAHMIKDVSNRLTRITSDKSKRQFILYCFALLQTEHNLQSAKKIFSHICILFNTSNTSERVESSVGILKQLIKRRNVENEVTDAVGLPDDDLNQIEVNETHTYLRRDTIKDNSKWRQEFMKVADAMDEEETDADEDDDIDVTSRNLYYTPGLRTLLLDNFLHVYPLWSAVLLGDLGRYQPPTEVDNPKVKAPRPNRATNALIENWFGNVKKDFCPGGRLRLTPGQFIRKAFVNITGRLGETVLKSTGKRIRSRTDKNKKGEKTKAREGKYFSAPAQNLSSPKPEKQLTKRRKMPRKQKVTENESNPEEVWKRTKDRKGTYFCSPPERDIQPESVKPDVRNDRQTSTSKLTCPAWGGNDYFKGKRVFLDNTCTIDNLLWIISTMINNYPLLRRVLNDSQQDICRHLLMVCTHVSHGDWVQAKIHWLHRVCKMELQVHQKQTWDAFGSEYDMFARYMSAFQSNHQKSSCSNGNCPRRETTINSGDIFIWGTVEETKSSKTNTHTHTHKYIKSQFHITCCIR